MYPQHGAAPTNHSSPNFQLPFTPPRHLIHTTTAMVGKSAINEVVTRDYTIHLHRRVNGVQFKKRAPRAVKAVKEFARQQLGTTDVRIDPQLNKELWKQGVRGVPHRIRVRISRKRNDEEGAKEKLFSYVQAVNATNFKGLQTEVVEDAEEDKE